MDLYSIMCVSDRTKALLWYRVFFGRAADEIIGEEHLWQAGENAWVVVDDRDVRAGRVGRAMIALGVTGLDDILARRAAHSIDYHRPGPRGGVSSKLGHRVHGVWTIACRQGL